MPKLKKIQDVVSPIANAVSVETPISLRVASLEEGQAEILKILREDRESRASVKVASTKTESVTVTRELPPTPNQFPVPMEYRDLVGTILNKDFGINLEPLSDSPAFQFTIVVPEKYSQLTAEQKKTFGADMRSKVITYAQGVNGVKEWVERVFSSFSPETKSLIVQQR